MSTVWNIRNIPDYLAKDAKVWAAMHGVSLRNFVIGLVEEAVYGDDEGGTKGGVGSDNGKVWRVNVGGKEDVRDADEKAGGLPKSKGRGKDVRGVRGGIRAYVKPEGGDTGDSLGEVLGSSGSSQPESGAVGDGSREDSVGKGSGQRYLGKYAHAKGCPCEECRK
jgi:hypothetical protein